MCAVPSLTFEVEALCEYRRSKPQDNFATKTGSACAGDIVTEEQQGLLIKVVPERDGHRLELQWSVPPESHAYKTFPCSYLRCADCMVYKDMIQLVWAQPVIHV